MVVTRRPIKWEEIDFPQEWVIENATQPQNNINTEVSEIEQLNDGTVKIRFHEPINMLTDNRSMSSRISRSNSSYISPVDYIVQVPSRASTSQIRETYKCDNIKIDRDNIVKPIRRASSDLDITESEINFLDGITGRWSDNSETIRTLLQNLRCKSLTSFRYYKDIFLCRVMKLPECNSTHWKSKFIDGLPTLFAERVRRYLRGDDHTINYDNYTYGKLISACVQEGLSLCNEIKLNQQIKRHRLTERKQLGEFCEQFAFDIPKQKSKDEEVSHKKKKSSKKDYEKWKKKKIEKKLRRAEEAAREYSSTSEDLKALQQEEYLTSEDECSPCQQGMACEKDDDGDDLYKIYEQFKELRLNFIDNDKVIELLQNIKDPEIRAQIIHKISDSKEKELITEKDYIPKEIPTKEGSYTMAEVKNLLLERRKMTSSPTTISDLKEEIDNLKEDIIRLKEKNVVIEVRLDAIQTLQSLDDKASESSSSMEGENDSLDLLKNLSLKNNKTDFLYSLKAFTSQKRGRGEGRSNSGRGGHILAQQGNKTLTSFNVSHSTASSSGTSGIDTNHPMYKEFMDFMKSKNAEDNSQPSYSSVLMDEENIEVFDMKDKKEVILLLEESDLRWRNEPWQIMTSHTDDTCLAGEGQDIDDEEEDLETILKRYQQQMEESSTSITHKGKNKI
ncbi:hypothetical protein H5410_003514 [Solanum commersonii]|uniref:Uncharacterized protein n=1 Tax=Solanum commersonii TaxID=4109 RepID=A0A9J6B4W6_SOLCO|nr:hypothetical protein H5410_003514 [Solanum commersonii]